jgi:hypothetical protein
MTDANWDGRLFSRGLGAPMFDLRPAAGQFR